MSKIQDAFKKKGHTYVGDNQMVFALLHCLDKSNIVGFNVQSTQRHNFQSFVNQSWQHDSDHDCPEALRILKRYHGCGGLPEK